MPQFLQSQLINIISVIYRRLVKSGQQQDQLKSESQLRQNSFLNKKQHQNMGKNKYKNKNQNDQDQDFGKKKKNVIAQQLLMDKSNMDFTDFIPLLPEDVFYPPYQKSTDSTKALLKIITDFNYLLYLQPKSFWATVTYNISFGRCLSSCLSQLSARWMNRYRFLSEQEDNDDFQFIYRTVKDSDAYSYTEALHQVLLKLIHRIMSFQEQDPRLNEIYNFGENTITKMNIFSFPKLFQLIEIYSQQQENHKILKIISKNYLRTVFNAYKYFIDLLLPHMIKKMQQNNRDMKILTDREQFGINYSYKRMNLKILSPGQQELKRKVIILINYISFLKLIKNTKFLTEEIHDHVFFNYQVNLVLENAFYELDAAYKVWNYQTMENRLLPLVNQVFVQIRDYFVEYFERVNQRVIKKNIKSNTTDAYVRSLQRILVDYGKRQSLGKKGNNSRNLTLFKIIMKKINLVQMLRQLYVDQEENKTYELNMEYLIDFKLALEDCTKQENQYINEDEMRQQEVQQQTQVPDDVDINDIDSESQESNHQQKDLDYDLEQQQRQEQSQKMVFSTPKDQDRLQLLVSKKYRQDDYYEQLYMKQQQRFKIQYDDEYDDLVDYAKRPLFMDSASSDSENEQQVNKRLVTNQDNQRVNQQKHIKFEEKQKLKHNQPKYSKVTRQEKQTMGQKFESKRQDQPSKVQKHTQKDDGKKKYVAKDKGNALQQLLLAQNMPGQGLEQKQHVNHRGNNEGGRGGGQGNKNKFIPNNNDKKDFNDKGRNSNKNRQHGNPSNQTFRGEKKYKAKY